MAPDAQHWGGASGVGSWPGTDPLEAVRTVLDLLPDLPFLPELPARGPHADATGRSTALPAGPPAPLPAPPSRPELRAAGPHAAVPGRSTALLAGLPVDLQPSGWRLVARPSQD